MSKKKPRETAVITTIEDSAPEEVSSPNATTETAGGDAGSPLLAEVQSFLNKREELARKLADEIAATETKLAELKKTAAALFPESTPVAQLVKDKKVPKKLPKAKPLPPKATEESATVAEPVISESTSEPARPTESNDAATLD